MGDELNINYNIKGVESQNQPFVKSAPKESELQTKTSLAAIRSLSKASNSGPTFNLNSKSSEGHSTLGQNIYVDFKERIQDLSMGEITHIVKQIKSSGDDELLDKILNLCSERIVGSKEETVEESDISDTEEVEDAFLDFEWSEDEEEDYEYYALEDRNNFENDFDYQSEYFDETLSNLNDLVSHVRHNIPSSKALEEIEDDIQSIKDLIKNYNDQVNLKKEASIQLVNERIEENRELHGYSENELAPLLFGLDDVELFKSKANQKLGPLLEKIDEKLSHEFKGKEFETRLKAQKSTINEFKEEVIKPLQKKNQLGKIVTLSRRTFKDLLHSHVVFGDSALRKTHKRTKQMNRFYLVPTEKGFIGKGGIKNVEALFDQSERKNFVRAKVNAVGVIDERMVTMIEDLKEVPHIMTGIYHEYKSEKTGEKVQVFIDKFMNTDGLKLIEKTSSKTEVSQTELEATMPIKTRIKLIQQLAIGLKGVHEKGYVHFDIKPENCFIHYDKERDNVEGNIADFDMTKKIGKKDVTFAGTPLYMAPEMMKRYSGIDSHLPWKNTKEAQQTDVYSLGLTFFQLLTGKDLPIPEASTDGEFLNSIMNLSYKDFAENGFPEPDNNQSMQHLIWEMINPQDPSARPSMDEVLDRMNQFL